MQIFIDNNNLDFSLEGEQRLGEVVRAVQRWLRNSRFGMTSLRVDDAEMPLNAPERWHDRPVDAVRKVEIATRTIREIQAESFETLLEYLVLLQKAVREHRESEAGEILREWPYVSAGLAQLLPFAAREADTGNATTTSPAGSASQPEFPLQQAMQVSGLLTGKITDDDARRSLLETVRSTIVLVTDRMREIVHPAEEAASAARLLNVSIPRISEVSVLLQTGKDADAMKAILQFSEIMSKLVRVVPYLRDEQPDLEAKSIAGKTIEATTEEMNAFLTEIVEALATGDSVLVGDLLEYEIAPRATLLAGFFEGDASAS